MTVDQALEAVDIYQEIPLDIVGIDVKEALRLAGQHNIYAYDAYVLQCAIEQNSPLVSLDRRLVEIAKRAGIKILERISG